MALLIDRRGMSRHRTRSLTPNICMVGPVGDPADQFAFQMHGSNQGQVVEMGPSVVRVVDGVLDPGLQIDVLQDSRYRGRH